MSVASGSGRSAFGLAALAAVAFSLGLAWAAPAAAEFFSPTEGLSADGTPKITFDVNPYLFLPHFNGTIGLDRGNGEDINIDRPRPTIADLVANVSFAADCDCLIRYGNFMAETDFIYISVKEKTHFPPLPPSVPDAYLNTKEKVFFISPGVGYRLFSSVPYKISLDARAGFTYSALTADADFQAGEFATSGSHTLSSITPWLGERFDYFPSHRWRIENTFSVTGLGANNGTIGYSGKLSASYMFSSWFDVQLGYGVVETYRNVSIGPLGQDRSFRVLLYGPVAALGFRF
jgi:hypothetical protein